MLLRSDVPFDFSFGSASFLIFVAFARSFFTGPPCIPFPFFTSFSVVWSEVFLDQWFWLPSNPWVGCLVERFSLSLPRRLFFFCRRLFGGSPGFGPRPPDPNVPVDLVYTHTTPKITIRPRHYWHRFTLDFSLSPMVQLAQSCFGVLLLGRGGHTPLFFFPPPSPGSALFTLFLIMTPLLPPSTFNFLCDPLFPLALRPEVSRVIPHSPPQPSSSPRSYRIVPLSRGISPFVPPLVSLLFFPCGVSMSSPYCPYWLFSPVQFFFFLYTAPGFFIFWK